MTISRGRLADIQTIPSTAGALITNSSAEKVFIGGFTIHNTNTTAEVVQIYLVPDSGGSLGTAALTNRVLRVSLDADSSVTYAYPGDGLVLQDTNDSLQGVTTTASKVTFVAHGVKDV